MNLESLAKEYVRCHEQFFEIGLLSEDQLINKMNELEQLLFVLLKNKVYLIPNNTEYALVPLHKKVVVYKIYV